MRKLALALLALLLAAPALAQDVINPQTDASKLTTGTLAAARGGTGVSNSANTTVTTATSIGRGQYQGTNTNDNATAGNIGEYVIGTLVAGSATSITSATGSSKANISLTAGDWDVSAIGCVTAAASTVLVNQFTSASATLDTLDNTVDRAVQANYGSGIVPNGGTNCIALPVSRFSLSATTTVYIVVQALFTTSTATGYGTVHARRVR